MLDANNCVLLLNELEDAGWTQRKRDAGDRRRHMVDITRRAARCSSGGGARRTRSRTRCSPRSNPRSASSCASCCARPSSTLHPRAEEPVATA